MKIILNPKYPQLRAFADDIEKQFASGKTLQDKRNVLKRCKFGEYDLCVKKFHRPRLLQRIVYRFLRKPKGKRAYRNAFKINEAGCESPDSVAYIEMRRFGLMTDSYYVCLFSPYTRKFYEFGDKEVDAETEEIVEAFTRATVRLHDAGMLHKDYSPGNILFDKVDGEWHFALIDTNRMRFGSVKAKRGCGNFARLWGQPKFFELIAHHYADLRNASPDDCLRWITAARRKFWTRYVMRHEAPFDIKY